MDPSALRALRRLALAALLGSHAACVELARRDGDAVRWTQDVEELTADCRACHQSAGAGPEWTDYPALFDCTEEGQRWVVPGDPESALLRALRDPLHAGAVDGATRERFEFWIVRDHASFASPLGHSPGFAAPGTPSFHGRQLRRDGYAALLEAPSERACAQCHGAPEAKGGAISCVLCHAGNLARDRCDGCHGAAGDPRPRVAPCDDPERQAAAGAHAAHRDPSASTSYPPIPCATCHVVPSNLADPGHVDDGTARAEVRFDPSIGSSAAYDLDTRTCRDTICHPGRAPMWSEGSLGSAPCARCHGNPPDDHASDACLHCHAAGFDADGDISGATHVDGRVDVGIDCVDCHADTTSPGFGLDDHDGHPSHLAPVSFAAPIACDPCHVTPLARDDVGHIDTPLPAEVRFMGAAATADAQLEPSWSRELGTCVNVGCHGAHLEGGRIETQSWLDPAARVECGDCHGLPPVATRGGAGVHIPTGPAECGVCHRTPDGARITIGTASISAAGRASHVNGCVDVEGRCPP